MCEEEVSHVWLWGDALAMLCIDNNIVIHRTIGCLSLWKAGVHGK